MGGVSQKISLVADFKNRYRRRAVRKHKGPRTVSNGGYVKPSTLRRERLIGRADDWCWVSTMRTRDTRMQAEVMGLSEWVSWLDSSRMILILG
jgi:hypothetical protein